MRVAIVTNNSDNLTTADYNLGLDLHAKCKHIDYIYVSYLLLFILDDIKANLVGDSETRHHSLTYPFIKPKYTW